VIKRKIFKCGIENAVHRTITDNWPQQRCESATRRQTKPRNTAIPTPALSMKTDPSCIKCSHCTHRTMQLLPRIS
ncbi:hypothetical protein J6590_015484, partial [Homalodisca vitripennis]